MLVEAGKLVKSYKAIDQELSNQSNSTQVARQDHKARTPTTVCQRFTAPQYSCVCWSPSRFNKPRLRVLPSKVRRFGQGTIGTLYGLRAAVFSIERE
jgi:hypothetical protein